MPGNRARRDEPVVAEPLIGQGRKPREWGIEITPIGGLPREQCEAVRITLIDRETGRRVGSRTVPWPEFRDCATGTFLSNIAEGVHT